MNKIVIVGVFVGAYGNFINPDMKRPIYKYDVVLLGDKIEISSALVTVKNDTMGRKAAGYHAGEIQIISGTIESDIQTGQLYICAENILPIGNSITKKNFMDPCMASRAKLLSYGEAVNMCVLGGYFDITTNILSVKRTNPRIGDIKKTDDIPLVNGPENSGQFVCLGHLLGDYFVVSEYHSIGEEEV